MYVLGNIYGIYFVLCVKTRQYLSQYLSFQDWLISLNIIIPSWDCFVANSRISLLWMSNIPQNKCAKIILSIHLLIDIWVVVSMSERL